MRIIWCILILASCAGYTLTGSVRFMLLEGVLIFLWIFRIAEQKKQPDVQPQPDEAAKNPLKRKVPARIIIFLAALLILFLPAPISLHSTMLWKYPFQRAYLNVYHNIQVPAWYPEFRGDVVSDYTMDYLASIMQGTGHFSVRFMTTPERASELERQFASTALYADAMPELSAESSFFSLAVPEEQWSSFSVPKPELWDGNVEIYADGSFWNAEGKKSPNATVYVLDAKCNWNHPASSAVIIDRETGAVQLSQFGWTKLANGK